MHERAAGSAKPIATMIPTQNCFIGVSTDAIKRREARSIKTTFSSPIARRGIPGRLAISGHRHARWQLK
jgi:hypothetical protein